MATQQQQQPQPQQPLLHLHDDTGYDNPINRLPNNAASPAYTSATFNRQQSRPFEYPTAAPQQPMYSETSRFEGLFNDRMPPQPLYNTASYNQNAYEQNLWNQYGTVNAATMGAAPRMRMNNNRRAQLPSAWTDSAPVQPQHFLPSNLYATPLPSQIPIGFNDLQQDSRYIQQGGPSSTSQDADGDELIPTAIVIKNIPFSIKKEYLQTLMSEMHLPAPYAFNYHFDNGIFRGLAFANFQDADDTAIVIQGMNGLEVQGRKLRVEYKKMLPVHERDRIEREKRERRGQLEEQHRAPSSLHGQTSVSSLNSGLAARSTPTPVSSNDRMIKDVDLNDRFTFEHFMNLSAFKKEARTTLVIPPPMSPAERKVIHALAHHMGLYHHSSGEGSERHIQITKFRLDQPKNLLNKPYDDSGPRALNRAATVDFSDMNNQNNYPTLRNQTSDFLGVPSSPGGENGIGRPVGLRGAKSFGDLQIRQPSPALSSSSFTANLTQNAARFANEYKSNQINGQNGDHVSANQRRGQEDTLVNSFSSMNMYDRQPLSTRPHGRLGAFGSETQVSTGPIGSQRPLNGSTAVNGAYDESRNGNSGISTDWHSRVSSTADWKVPSRAQSQRQNGHTTRNSDELNNKRPLEEAWR